MDQAAGHPRRGSQDSRDEVEDAAHQARFVGQGARTGGVLSTDQKFASKEIRECGTTGASYWGQTMSLRTCPADASIPSAW